MTHCWFYLALDPACCTTVLAGKMCPLVHSVEYTLIGETCIPYMVAHPRKGACDRPKQLLYQSPIWWASGFFFFKLELLTGVWVKGHLQEAWMIQRLHPQKAHPTKVMILKSYSAGALYLVNPSSSFLPQFGWSSLHPQQPSIPFHTVGVGCQASSKFVFSSTPTFCDLLLIPPKVLGSSLPSWEKHFLLEGMLQIWACHIKCTSGKAAKGGNNCSLNWIRGLLQRRKLRPDTENTIKNQD